MDSTIWDERSISRELKYEKNLSFTAVPTCEEDDFGFKGKKLPRDPLSHRIIEKRRRDRMNNCLSDLSRLIPSEYMKKGRGRVEKTEIIEMAIRHMKHLQAHPCTEGSCCPLVAGYTKVEPERNQNDRSISSHIENSRIQEQNQPQAESKMSAAEHYRLGFNECLSETMHFLVEIEGFFSSDSVCLQLTSHLHNYCDNILKGKVFMAQVRSGSESKRRIEELDDICDIKQGMNGDGYTNGYHHSTPDSSRSGHQIQEHNGCNASNPVTPFQSHGVFPADSSSNILQSTYNSHHNLPRSIAFSQQLSPTLSCQGSDPVGSYKFKEDIRKRFCKEAGSVIPVNNGQSLSTRRIPVFALSSRGSYYIPLTLDLPYLDDEVSRSDQSLLHPVTISVCFPTQHHSPSQQSSPFDTGQ